MTVRRVPIPYSTIQEAINDADPGDTILVACGVYGGSVTVDEPRLRIEGESPGCTILQGPDLTGFSVVAPLVTITGFTVRNFEVGIDVRDAHCAVRGNRILDCNASGINVSEEQNLAIASAMPTCKPLSPQRRVSCRFQYTRQRDPPQPTLRQTAV